MVDKTKGQYIFEFNEFLYRVVHFGKEKKSLQTSYSYFRNEKPCIQIFKTSRKKKGKIKFCPRGIKTKGICKGDIRHEGTTLP